MNKIKISFLIALTNYSIGIIAVLFLLIGKGILKWVAWVSCEYSMLSIIPAFVGIIIGIIGIIRKRKSNQNIIGIVLNSIYIIVYILVARLAWPAMMGV
jgi:hypothetical protein